MNKFNRRDFLKLAGLLPLSFPASRLPVVQTSRPNILIIVFDAFSAYNVSLYGYGRATTPNLDRLSQRAIVYHNHHASSSFTTPGTASLLTGTLPWTHRAMESKGTVIDPYITRNIFSALKDYYRIAYTHNGWANILLEQFRADLEELVPWKSLFLSSFDKFVPAWFGRDSDIATVGWTRTVDVASEGYSYSLLFSRIYNVLLEHQYARLIKDFPRGLPSTGNIGSEFLLEEGIDWVAKRLPQTPSALSWDISTSSRPTARITPRSSSMTASPGMVSSRRTSRRMSSPGASPGPLCSNGAGNMMSSSYTWMISSAASSMNWRPPASSRIPG